MTVSTAWTRNPKSCIAFRGHGSEALTLLREGGSWSVFRQGFLLFHVDTETPDELDSVIVQVDLLSPPAGWTVEAPDIWTRGPWICSRTTTGWKVHSQTVKVRQPFSSCDRARKWVDLRVNRICGLRGSRLRQSARSTRTLPDVRVTVEEHAGVIDLAHRLGVTYADLMRSSLRLIAELHAEGSVTVRPVAYGKEVHRGPGTNATRT
jgi:hypothetical protein